MNKEIDKNVHRFIDSSQEAKKAAVDLLVNSLNDAVLANKPVLFLMSGGSWIEVMNMVDDSRIDLDKLALLLTLTSLDERNSNGSDNNYLKIVNNSAFVQRLIGKGAQVIETVPASGMTVENFGMQINERIANWLETNPDGRVVATVGVGGVKNVEGHTAGIEPMLDGVRFHNLFEQDNYYVGYQASQLSPPERTTATFKLINRIDNMVVMILGAEEKSGALRKSLDPILPLHESPCSIIGRNIERAAIVTDIA